MKKILFLTAALVFTIFSQLNAQSKLENWTELKTFHGVMSQTFHPSESGDLKPIRERIHEMQQKAKMLASSKIPADFDNAKVREALTNLIMGTEKLNRVIESKGSDDEVKKSLAELHDTFHQIVEKCQKNDESHKE